MELNSLFDVLVEELTDLHSAEEQLVASLPNMAAAAHSYELRDAFEAHLNETVGHVERLQQAFVDVGLETIPAGTCKAMRGLLQEAADVIKATGDPVAIDAALIGAAQRIEHYEIAGYGTASTWRISGCVRSCSGAATFGASSDRSARRSPISAGWHG